MTATAAKSLLTAIAAGLAPVAYLIPAPWGLVVASVAGSLLGAAHVRQPGTISMGDAPATPRSGQ
jgi:hypothetical protein